MPAFDAATAAPLVRRSLASTAPAGTMTRAHDAAEPRRLATALADLRLGLARWHLPAALAALDIRNRYRGSVLGPLWLTLSMAIMVASLGLLYSRLFGLGITDYLPFLVVSLTLWSLISQTATEACVSLTGAEGIIRQLPLPYSVHALRTVFRNAVVAAHHLPLVLVLLVVLGRTPNAVALLALPGLALLILASFAGAVFLGMLCARFRDIAQIVASAFQFAFFLSPVIWKPEMLGERAVWLPLNPFYTLLEVVRGPLLGEAPSAAVWTGAVVATAIVVGLAMLLFVRYRARIAFWV